MAKPVADNNTAQGRALNRRFSWSSQAMLSAYSRRDRMRMHLLFQRLHRTANSRGSQTHPRTKVGKRKAGAPYAALQLLFIREAMGYLSGKIVVGNRRELGNWPVDGIGICARRSAGCEPVRCREDRLESLKDELSQGGAAAIHTTSLWTLPGAPRSKKDAWGLPVEWSAIDVLVNNAGLSRGLGEGVRGRSGELGRDD